MLILKEKDYLEVSVNSLIADYDRLTLTNLYQPIIGYKAVSLYFTLLSEYDNQKINPVVSHEILFNRTMMNASEFVDARKNLEAIGLLKTFVSDLNGLKLYQYELYAPKTPKLFFDNTLLYGMLIQSIGETEASKLKTLYTIKNRPEGKEITASFIEVFSPDFDNPAFMKAMENGGSDIITRQSAKLNSGFSYELFFKTLSEISQIKAEAFSKKDMKEIERLATLYGVSEESAANTVRNNYNPLADKNHRLDFEQITKIFAEEINYRSLANHGKNKLNGEMTGNTDLARKINLMEQANPKRYLSILQNGSQPSISDLMVVNTISSKFRLPNSVINAIVDYVLAVNDNVLSKPFAEKIAGSVAREGITTAIDAMNYLKKVSSKRKKTTYDQVQEESPAEEETKEEPKRVLNKEDLLRQLEEDDNNGEN